MRSQQVNRTLFPGSISNAARKRSVVLRLSEADGRGRNAEARGVALAKAIAKRKATDCSDG
jgi:hypothetical protein